MKVWTLFAGVNLILLVGGIGAWAMTAAAEAGQGGLGIVLGVVTVNAVIATLALLVRWLSRMASEETT